MDEEPNPIASDPEGEEEASSPEVDRSPESVWGCPCGRRGTYGEVIGHRKGYKKRPDCRSGKIFFIAGAGQRVRDVETSDPTGLKTEDQSNDEDDEPEPPAPVIRGWEASDRDDPEDEDERMARMLMEHAGALQNGHVSTNGHRDFPEQATIPEGEFGIEPMVTAPQPSIFRESITIPATFKIMYDYMRSMGWRQGDGTISSWVEDMVLDHWKACLGKAIVVVNREDMDLG